MWIQREWISFQMMSEKKRKIKNPSVKTNLEKEEDFLFAYWGGWSSVERSFEKRSSDVGCIFLTSRVLLVDDEQARGQVRSCSASYWQSLTIEIIFRDGDPPLASWNYTAIIIIIVVVVIILWIPNPILLRRKLKSWTFMTLQVHFGAWGGAMVPRFKAAGSLQIHGCWIDAIPLIACHELGTLIWGLKVCGWAWGQRTHVVLSWQGHMSRRRRRCGIIPWHMRTHAWATCGRRHWPFTLGEEEEEEEDLTVVGRVAADDVLGTVVGVVARCKGFEGLGLLRATFVRVDVNLEGIEGHEQPELDFFG